jgi:4-diphosphocytidyl-2-C-methyl-D-erythritol kinase
MEPCDLALPRRILLVKPPFGVSTPWAYKTFAALKAGGNLASASETRLGDLLLVNDLESAVFPKYITLRTLKHWLGEQPGVEAALMSGSGSTIFAILSEDGGSDGQDARLREDVAREFGETFWTCVTEIAG